MRSDCMTCMEMCGNGVRITGMIATIMLPRMTVHGWTKMIMALVFCVGGRGMAFPSTVALRIATGACWTVRMPPLGFDCHCLSLELFFDRVWKRLHRSCQVRVRQVRALPTPVISSPTSEYHPEPASLLGDPRSVVWLSTIGLSGFRSLGS